MSDERYEYDYDAVGLDRLALKKLMLNCKTHLKKCPICGKTKLMQKNQVICSECTAKAKKESYKRTHCSICNRNSQSLILVDELRYCSFCLQRKNTEIVKPTENPLTHCKNPECRGRIHKTTFIKNSGLCKECLENEKLTGGVI